MKRTLRLLLVLGILVPTLLLSGCLLNIFQTAHTIGAGNVGLAIGTGLFDLAVGDDGGWFLTPQARLTIGLTDGIDIGLHSGLLVSLEGGEPGWMGVLSDLKFALFDDPESFSLAMGFGGGYSVEALGACAFGEIFLDSNLRILPVFFVYQPQVTLSEAFAVSHHGTAGLKLRLSPNARLLLQVDYRYSPGLTELFPLLSYGLALEITF